MRASSKSNDALPQSRAQAQEGGRAIGYAPSRSREILRDEAEEGPGTVAETRG